MARLCLPEKKRTAIQKALKNGDIVIAELYEMSSKERNKLFSKHVGESSNLVNAKFEQAMLSTQKKALRNWISSTTTAKDPIRRDMLKRVERIKKFLDPDDEFGFLEDIAADKLGIRVTEKEARKIKELSDVVEEKKARIPENYTEVTDEGLEYGFALDRFRTYVGDLKVDANKLVGKERLKVKNIGRNIVDIGRITKSMVASIDNSFLGRQGIKVMFTNPKLWIKTLGLSLKVFGKELIKKGPGLFKSRDDAIMSAVRAKIYAHPNHINGKYKAAKNGYGLGVLHEEAFPTSFPERAPFLGRFFKASETAFSASALHMRAKLANSVIKKAEKNGVDMLDEATASAWGNYVTSMTGRGELPKFAAPAGESLNALMFSPRFLVSNWNTLTFHALDSSANTAVKMQSAKDLVKISTGVFSLLAVSEMMQPGSVEWDPRKTNFGKVKVGDTYMDVTGGMASLARFGFRFITGKSYSSNTRKWSDLSDAGFGEQTRMDVFWSFIEGKAAPIFAAGRDWAKGENFQGEKPDLINTSLGLVTPISIEIFMEELKKGNDELGLIMVAEGLGFSPTPARYRGYSDKWKKLQKEDNEAYNKAIKQVGDNFTKRAEQLEASPQWERMDREEQNKELFKIRAEETDRVMQRYGIQ